MKICEIKQGYEHIKIIIDLLIEKYDIEYKAHSDCGTMTYAAMVGAYLASGKFIVYSGGDHGFLGEEYNIKFRALHDFMHYQTNLTFSFKDERLLSRITGALFSNMGAILKLNRSVRNNIQAIIEAEIGGQIEYYAKHKKYVTNQKQFIIDYFNKEAA